MSAEEFRRYGHIVVDRIARYMEEVERSPVLSRAHPGAIRATLPAEPPRSGEDMAAILADFDDKIISMYERGNEHALNHRHLEEISGVE